MSTKLLFYLGLLLLLFNCGKKSSLEKPENSTYPKDYPLPRYEDK